MPLKITSTIKNDSGTTVQHFVQALMYKDCNVLVETSDGPVWTRALHIASKWVREMVQDRGSCCHDPILFLPDVDKMTVALLDRILMFGYTEITLNEGGNIQRIYNNLRKLAQSLGLEHFNVDVTPVTKEELDDDSNNNKVIEVVTIDDEEKEDFHEADIIPEKTNEDEESGENYYDEDENYYDDEESVSSAGGTSSFEDMTSYEKADLNVDRVVNELPESRSGVLVLSGGDRMIPYVDQVTPDKRPRRDSIESNFESPDILMTPIDEVMTKGSDSRPERGSRKKPLTPINCNFDLKC